MCIKTNCRKILAFLSVLVILICTIFSNVGLVVVKADTSTEPIPLSDDKLIKLSEDTTLSYNSVTDRFEGETQLKVSNLSTEECLHVDTNNIIVTGNDGSILNVELENSEYGDTNYKNGDIIKIKYYASNYVYNKDYNVNVNLTYEVKKDYRADEIPNISNDWDYYLSGDKIILTEYIGSDTDVIVYPQYNAYDPYENSYFTYNTYMDVTTYDTSFSNDGDEDTSDASSSYLERASDHLLVIRL